MKKILVAVDFSAAAENAARYAVQLSENFKGLEITLYNAYDNTRDVEGEGSIKYLRLAELRELVQKIMIPQKAKVLYITEGGDFITLLEKYITANNIDLLLIGNNKDEPSKKGLSAKNIQSMISNINIPVMIIPPNAKYK
jgi:nucleotide-binding universal stress UspA family protein